jgi:ubiquinone/menaquinone biosynthesis C-methylase UbiE
LGRVDYDRIASGYDQRFEGGRRSDTASALLELARQLGAERILEVGCGTGRWLGDLSVTAQQLHGLDLSKGMLREASNRPPSLALVQGRAAQLPYPDATFDLVYCVNAIHHFGRPRDFVSEARRLLRLGGALCVIGMDALNQKDRWYVYDYFDGVYSTDLARFPSWGTVLDWMVAEGLRHVECRVIERIAQRWIGREVLCDPFLEKDSCSQLALLTESDYAAGLSRIEAALHEAEENGERLTFATDLALAMIAGTSVGTRG